MYGIGKALMFCTCFSKEQMDRDVINFYVFDNLYIRNSNIEFNGEYYPEYDLMLDFENNEYITGYQMVT